MPLIPPATVPVGYKPQSDDTHVDTDALYFLLLRQKSLLDRAHRLISFNRATRQITLAAVCALPTRTPRQAYLQRRLGTEWTLSVFDGDVVIQDPIALAQKIVALLSQLGIEYYIGGSVASSLWGESRYTEDLDMVIEVGQSTLQPLTQAFLESSFYISEVAVADALSQRCSSFNVLDNESLEKADLFVSRSTDEFARSKMARRVQFPLPDGESLWICSAEDIILQKLVWGRGSQSQKQWRDVLGVLKLQGPNLDSGYLTEWAARLSITAPLSQAWIEAGLAVEPGL
jgi:hypothetical protein